MAAGPIDRREVFGDEEGGYSERIAPGYFDNRTVASHVARYRWAARFVEGLNVLDVACGTGYGAPVLRARGLSRTLVSADASNKALVFGRERYDLTPVNADAHRLPFPSATFDVLISLETIEHLERPHTFAEEAARILVDGGTFLVSVPNTELVDDSANHHHLTRFSRSTLEALVHGAGFTTVAVYGQGWHVKSRLTHFWGLRRLAWELEKLSKVSRLPSRVASPNVWCLRLSKGRASS
jgi:ubiquinone/menaquinone biosynthesis C-methylase UbiE